MQLCAVHMWSTSTYIQCIFPSKEVQWSEVHSLSSSSVLKFNFSLSNGKVHIKYSHSTPSNVFFDQELCLYMIGKEEEVQWYCLFIDILFTALLLSTEWGLTLVGFLSRQMEASKDRTGINQRELIFFSK